MNESIAIVGVGVAVPGANNAEQLWALLCGDKPVFSLPGNRFRASSFHAADPAAPDRTYSTTAGFLSDFQPEQRLANELKRGEVTEEVWGVALLRHCLYQACSTARIHSGAQSCCYIGGFADGMQQIEERLVVDAARRAIVDGSANPPTQARIDLIDALLRRHYGLPNTPAHELLPHRIVQRAVLGIAPAQCEIAVVDAACASALYAIDLGVKSLRDQSCDLAFCGGLFLPGPRYHVVFSKLHGLSASGKVRPFDKAADGTLFSDGAAVLALKRLDDAIAAADPILGIVSGVGTSSDGSGKAIYAPAYSGQRLCIERARSGAAVTAADIDWVLAHGTATAAGDAVELAVLGDTAEPHSHLVTSNKSIMGHTGWCAGALSVVHAILALRHQYIPAHRGLATPAAALHSTTKIVVPTAGRNWRRADHRIRRAGISAFGFGGTNAHLILQEHVDRTPAARTPGTTADPSVVLVAWSAHLPGNPAPADVPALLSDRPTAERRRFIDYPPPSYEETHLPPRAARALDRGQVMALRVTRQFAHDHGEIWADCRDTTGVIAAHTGTSRASIDNLTRCYADDLLSVATLPRADRDQLNAYVESIKATVIPSGPDSLVGFMPSVLASRIAHRLDIHGAAFTVDSGLTSGSTAINAAIRHLREGELTLALVVGISSDSSPEVASMVGLPADGIAEGAFLLALTLERTAQQHGWQPLATIELDTISRPTQLPDSSATSSYVGAEILAALIQRTAAHRDQ